jgi:thymidylate synthase ThyX
MTKTSSDDVKPIIDSIVASQKGLQEIEQTILKSLQAYSETVTKNMNELVKLNLPSEDERKAAERVRVEVLTMTAEVIRMVKDSMPKPNGGAE